MNHSAVLKSISVVLFGAVTGCGGDADSGGTISGGAGSTAPSGGAASEAGATSAISGGQGGGAATGTTGGTTTLSTALSLGEQAFVTTYATPYCTRLESCCASEGFGSAALTNCVNNELSYYADSLRAGTASVNATGAATLLAAIEDTCDQFSYTLFGGLVVGTIAIGAECTEGYQCNGTNVMCQVGGGATTGTCVELSRGTAGDACAVTCDDMTPCLWTVYGTGTGTAACWDADGLKCDATGVCVAVAGIGQSCATQSCGAHADCISDSCVARAKLSETCSSVSCDSTLSCDTTTLTCVKASIASSSVCGS